MRTRYELSACPVCATSDHAVVADADAIRAEVEALWEHHAGDGRPAIPEAQLLDRVTFTQDFPLQIVRCTGCGLLFRNPRERDVRAIYAAEQVEEASLEKLRAAQLDAFHAAVARLTDLHGGPGRVLEVGSYVGAFLEAARTAGWQAHGIDVNPHAVAFARRFGHDVAAGAIEDSPATGRFDAIAFWNCFDQLPDPVAAARAARERLRPGGFVVVRVPNGELYLTLRTRLHGPLGGAARALLARHNLLGFPYRHGFTRTSLRGLLERCGFVVIDEQDAGVLPTEDGDSGLGGEQLLAAAERALRPLVGPPWLEVYAIRDRRRVRRDS